MNICFQTVASWNSCTLEYNINGVYKKKKKSNTTLRQRADLLIYLLWLYSIKK